MGSLLFTDITLSEQEKLSGGNSNTDIEIIRQSYSSGVVEEVVNVSGATISSKMSVSTSTSVTITLMIYE